MTQDQIVTALLSAARSAVAATLGERAAVVWPLVEPEARQAAEDAARELLALLAVPEPVRARARVIAGEHTKKKFPIWTVPIERRISGEEFRKAKEKAEEGDGYYSSFRGGGAVVGFVFRDESKANAFAAWLGEEKPDAPEATGPTLAEAKTSNGQISAFALDKRDLYYQRYREQADKVISYLPSGFTMERRDSKHGQIYVFLDSKDRLLTRADYARFGAPEKESAEIEAAREEVEKRQAVERARDERIAEAQLESARNWNLNGRKIYELTSDEYEGAMGVDRPYIGEISGLQYSRMSGRARRAYDEKRRGEWARSAGVGSAWRRKVEQLALAGDIDMSTPGLSDEARGVVAQVESLRAAKEAERARVEKARRKELAATAATRRPERALEAENRAKEIRNLVSRGTKRETGAVNVSLSGFSRGFVRFPNGRVVNLGITNRDWGLYNTLSGKVYAEGEFTDQDSPESVAQSIYAALRKWDLEHRNPA